MIRSEACVKRYGGDRRATKAFLGSGKGEKGELEKQINSKSAMFDWIDRSFLTAGRQAAFRALVEETLQYWQGDAQDWPIPSSPGPKVRR